MSYRRCTVAASSNIGALSLYVTYNKFRKSNKLILSQIQLHFVFDEPTNEALRNAELWWSRLQPKFISVVSWLTHQVPRLSRLHSRRKHVAATNNDEDEDDDCDILPFLFVAGYWYSTHNTAMGKWVCFLPYCIQYILLVLFFLTSYKLNLIFFKITHFYLLCIITKFSLLLKVRATAHSSDTDNVMVCFQTRVHPYPTPVNIQINDSSSKHIIY